MITGDLSYRLGFIDRAAVVVHAGMGSNHRRSIKKEGKAKVVSAIQFLAALAVLH